MLYRTTTIFTKLFLVNEKVVVNNIREVSIHNKDIFKDCCISIKINLGKSIPSYPARIIKYLSRNTMAHAGRNTFASQFGIMEIHAELHKAITRCQLHVFMKKFYVIILKTISNFFSELLQIVVTPFTLVQYD